MNTPITKLKDTILEMINHGGTEEDLFAVLAHLDNWGLKEEKEHIMMAFNDGKVCAIVRQVKTADKYYDLTYNK